MTPDLIQACLDFPGKLPQSILNLNGLSGNAGRNLLNSLGALCTQHLEVGTYMGTTLISAAYNNPGRFCGFDNFSQFGGEEELHKNLREYGSNISFINGDFNTISINELPNEIDFYFYDGAHGEEDHYNALKVLPNCQDIFLYVVDDWNGREAKDGTRRSLKDLPLNILFEYEIGHHTDSDRNGYWNGFGIFLLEKK